MTTTYLITGGAGNLARQLTSDLTSRGDRPVLVDIAEQPTHNTADGCQYVQADLSSRETIEQVVEKIQPDVIIHFASLLSGGSEADRPLAWQVNMSACTYWQPSAASWDSTPFPAQSNYSNSRLSGRRR